MATAAANLPLGTDSITATFVAGGNYATSSSTPPVVIAVNPPVAVPLPGDPIALPYTISTLAGGSTVASANTACAGSIDSFGDGCQATSMVFNGSSLDLRSVTADPFGSVYLTDANASLVRRIAPNGIITNFAGYVSGSACVPTATAGCKPNLVKLNKPRGVSADALGNVYIAGYSDNKVYKVSVSTGLLYLVAGTGSKPSSATGANGDGGTATSALLNGPRGIWADTIGNIYVADTTDNKIRVVDVTGNIQTVVGTGVASSTGDGGPSTTATISNPQGVLTDSSDNIYIADSSRIRVVCVTCIPGSGLYQLLTKIGTATPQNGYIYTLAGGGTAAYSGPALANTITMSPQKLAIDRGGNLYISDGGGVIWFVDSQTAFIRPIAGNTTTTCNPTATPNIGDGCPATQAIIGNGGNGIGVGSDTLGNLYISDTLNARIRKVSTGLQFSSTTTSATAIQPIQLHFIAGDNPASSNALVLASNEWSLSAPNCTTNSDTTVDCLLSSSFTPAVPGSRSTPLTVNSSAGNIAFLGLTGTGFGAGATLDPATQTTFGANLQVTALATDNSGNTYVSDATSKQLLRFSPGAVAQGSSATGTPLATLTAPGVVAVDARGFAYVADTSTGHVTQVSPAGTATILGFKFTSPAGLAIDTLNNLYVSDAGTQSIYQLNPTTGAQRTLAVGSLSSPAGLAIDPSGNLLIADPGAVALYRFNLQSAARTAIVATVTKPTAIAVDAAGNLLVADAASILAIPASANSAQFIVAGLTPSALAVDAAGNLYTNSAGAILKLTRTQGAAAFVGASSTPQTIALLSSGNQALNLTSISQTDTTNFTLTAAASTDCTLNGALPTAVPSGGACTLTATFTPQTAANFTDTATFNGNLTNAALSNPAAVQLVLAGQDAPPASNITLGTFSPASPVYGQTVTVSATVTAASGTPTGTVTFTVDGTTTTTVSLTSDSATTTLTDLSAGTHSVTGTYTSNNGFASSAAAAVTLTIAQAVSTVTLSANPSTPMQGQADLLTATVTGAGHPGGTVVFSSGATTLCTTTLSSAGVATCSFVPQTSGGIVVTAQYQGDTNHSASSTTLALNVYDAAIRLQFSSTHLIYPGATNVTVCVTAATNVTATGTVKIYDGTTLLTTQSLQGNGCAYWYISPGLSAGTHLLTAVYSGDKDNPTGTSTTTTVTVEPVAVNMGVSCWNASFAYGANYQCTVNLSSNAGSPLGSITYTYDGGSPVALPLSGGNVQFTITRPTAGTHTVIVAYAQQTNYAAATSQTETFTVTPAPVNVALTPSSWYASAGTSLTFQATVTSWSAGPPNANGTVSFYDGTALLATVPVSSSGQASYTTTSLAAGSHTITANYGAGTNYSSGSSSVTITLTQ
jgi:streptogramin lyase